MQFKKNFAAGASVVGLANAAALQGRNDAVVVVHQVVAQSTSVAYVTIPKTIIQCADDVVDCPESVTVVTSTIESSTTICPVTETNIVTSGTPVSTNSGPLPTVTSLWTSTQDVPGTAPVTSVASSASGGQSGSAPASSGTGSTSGPASASAPSSSPASSGADSSTLASPETSSAASQSASTISSTSRVTKTVTQTNAPETSTVGSAPSSAGTGVTSTASSSITTSFAFVPPPPSPTSTFSTNLVGPIGGTASGSGYPILPTNGTLVSPTPYAPTASIVPYTGGAAASAMVCNLVAGGLTVALAAYFAI